MPINITEQMPRYRCDYMGMVMQNPESQFCTFTVEEELAFGMENMQVPLDKMRERIQEVLAYVGMEGYEERDLNQLSGGQKQKVAIAAILVMQPEILLLDEPTANLDPQSRAEIFELLIRLAREDGKTIILVEHNLEEIAEEVDYLYTMTPQGEMSAHHDSEEIRKILVCAEKEALRAIRTKEVKEANREVILEMQDVAFSYPDGGKILDGVNFQIKERDFLAILGENGAGKSTMLNLIFQIYRQTKGRILLRGKPVESYRRKELYRRIGLVFQNPENQFVTNTVMDEMMFSLKKEKISQEEKEARVKEMLQRFHLENDVEKSPFVLSQGQKRRLSVATMLLTGQKMLFLDEPTYGQDFENRHELMRDMQKLNENGVTVIMITHDMTLVKEYADRVVVLKDGRIDRDETTEEYFGKHTEEEKQECLRI